MKLAVDNDLPEELKAQLSKSYLSGKGSGDVDFERKLFELIPKLNTDKDKFSIDELIVGWYREHKAILKRATVTNRLAKLVSDNKLEHENRVYWIPESDPAKS